MLTILHEDDPSLAASSDDSDEVSDEDFQSPFDVPEDRYISPFDDAQTRAALQQEQAEAKIPEDLATGKDGAEDKPRPSMFKNIFARKNKNLSPAPVP